MITVIMSGARLALETRGSWEDIIFCYQLTTETEAKAFFGAEVPVFEDSRAGFCAASENENFLAEQRRKCCQVWVQTGERVR